MNFLDTYNFLRHCLPYLPNVQLLFTLLIIPELTSGQILLFGVIKRVFDRILKRWKPNSRLSWSFLIYIVYVDNRLRVLARVHGYTIYNIHRITRYCQLADFSRHEVGSSANPVRRSPLVSLERVRLSWGSLIWRNIKQWTQVGEQVKRRHSWCDPCCAVRQLLKNGLNLVT